MSFWSWLILSGKKVPIKTLPKNAFVIDVSKHQGIIDWNKVKANVPKIDAAIIKATEGQDFVDIKFTRNVHGAKNVGLLIGCYHYASLNTSNILTDAHEEARDFVSALKLVPKLDIPPILDLEENKANLSPQQVLRWVNEFVETMNELGYPEIILYSYTPFLNKHLPIGHGLKMKLWIAGYVLPQRLKIPHGWTEYWMWQYTAKGRINGITGDVDLNTTKSLSEIRLNGF